MDGHVDEACETQKSIHQTNESTLPFSRSLSPRSRRHSSLWTSFFVALVRSTVLMALLAHRPAEERQDERQTDKTERQRTPERKETTVVYEKEKKTKTLFYRRESGDLRGELAGGIRG